MNEGVEPSWSASKANVLRANQLREKLYPSSLRAHRVNNGL
jgi:hypothetical protein